MIFLDLDDRKTTIIEQERQNLHESLLPNYQKRDDDIPKTTNIGWLKNYFQEDDDKDYFPSNSKYEKFMTFSPHGNLFQQREELENAVFLAYFLNRTLVIPPIILGLNIEFINPQELRQKLNTLRADKLESECSIKEVTKPERKETKYEIDLNCLNEFDSYSLLRWDSLFNLDFIKQNIHILHRRDFDQVKLEKMLNVTNSKLNVCEFKISSLNSIHSHKEKLLSFDCLSGKGLIDKDSPQDQLYWDMIDNSLTLNNPVVLDVSKKIVQKLGGKGNYVGVHARFLSTSNSKKFIQKSFTRLTLALKNYFNDIPQDLKGTSNDLCKLDFIPSSRVIYLATDLSRNDAILSSFLSKFPCVLILSDFKKILHPLLELYNPRDGTLLFKFLEPLVNSQIASSGMELFSVGDDTYSAYTKQLHKDTNNV
ncbi:10254_t:CDS:2 [Funneliformis geosporum]|uniref:9075_t:CDS:1 n=1 Tax=Funneliformis geosporum TaxID=1117311 RepID=A0A9W4SHZ7_9GLOM|nr:9075_t:CDS:2 [Funneliformis geosporum]CAI2172036.1 10254_t:CDS:2 [Funneliformis geosporum]